MKELKQMLVESFDLWYKMRWLKMINREVDKGRKLAEKLQRNRIVTVRLVQRYNELFGENLTLKVKKAE